MTEREINALAQLLARCPMTQAEALWVAALIERERLRARAEAEVAQAREQAEAT